MEEEGGEGGCCEGKGGWGLFAVAVVVKGAVWGMEEAGGEEGCEWGEEGKEDGED